VNFTPDSVSGSFKACLTIHILFETASQCLDMVLVDFLESSCPSLCTVVLKNNVTSFLVTDRQDNTNLAIKY
jgi:hypothetical protein